MANDHGSCPSVCPVLESERMEPSTAEERTGPFFLSLHWVCLALRTRMRNASKWNPIEHRLFSEVSGNWAGEPLDSYEEILNYPRTTKTKTGLTLTACLDRRNYPCGLKPTPDQLASLRLQRHETLPEWNYTIKTQL